ncbi:uncharacterized [Tachysurus ichikawai]
MAMAAILQALALLLRPPRNGDHDEGPLNFDDVLLFLIGPTRVCETEPADWTFPLTWDDEDASQVQPEPGWHLDQLTSTCPMQEDPPSPFTLQTHTEQTT